LLTAGVDDRRIPAQLTAQREAKSLTTPANTSSPAPVVSGTGDHNPRRSRLMHRRTVAVPTDDDAARATEPIGLPERADSSAAMPHLIAG
jgi:hypothetical protein